MSNAKKRTESGELSEDYNNAVVRGAYLLQELRALLRHKKTDLFARQELVMDLADFLKDEADVGPDVTLRQVREQAAWRMEISR